MKIKAKFLSLNLLCLVGYVALNLLFLAWWLDMSQSTASITSGVVVSRKPASPITGALRLTVQTVDGRVVADAVPSQWERAAPGTLVLIITARGKWSGVAYDCEVLELGKVGN